jgi:hypothetical protein
VVDGVEAPAPAAVEPAMRPVAEEIAEHDHSTIGTTTTMTAARLTAWVTTGVKIQ